MSSTCQASRRDRRSATSWSASHPRGHEAHRCGLTIDGLGIWVCGASSCPCSLPCFRRNHDVAGGCAVAPAPGHHGRRPGRSCSSLASARTAAKHPGHFSTKQACSQSWSSTSSPSAVIPQAASPVLVETAWVGSARGNSTGPEGGVGAMAGPRRSLEMHQMSGSVESTLRLLDLADEGRFPLMSHVWRLDKRDESRERRGPGAMEEGGDLLELFGSDLVAHRHFPAWNRRSILPTGRQVHPVF
jgi:hypothetical protein